MGVPVLLIDIQAERNDVNRIFDIAWICIQQSENWDETLLTQQIPKELTQEINHHFVQLPVGYRLSRTTKKMTGIKDNDFAQASSLDVVLHSLIAWIKSYSEQEIYVVAHYAVYEKNLLEKILDHRKVNYTFHWICTYQLSKRLVPYLLQHTLHSMSAYFNAPLSPKRSALIHCKSTYHIYYHILHLLLANQIHSFQKILSYLKAPVPKIAKRTLLDKNKRLNAPTEIGIYYLFNHAHECVYIGRSQDIRRRLNQHFTGYKSHSPWHCEMITQVVDLEYKVLPTYLSAIHQECIEIKKNMPHYNQLLKQTDSPVYTHKDQLFKWIVAKDLEKKFEKESNNTLVIIREDYIGPWVDRKFLSLLAVGHESLLWSWSYYQKELQKKQRTQHSLWQLDSLTTKSDSAFDTHTKSNKEKEKEKELILQETKIHMTLKDRSLSDLSKTQQIINKISELDLFQAWIPFLFAGRLVWQEQGQWWTGILHNAVIHESQMTNTLPINAILIKHARTPGHGITLPLITSRLAYDCARMSVKYLQQIAKQNHPCFWQAHDDKDDYQSECNRSKIWYQLDILN